MRVMAVKRIRSTVDEKEQKQLLMDLEVVMKSNDCPYIVEFYGALFKEVSIKFLSLILLNIKVCTTLHFIWSKTCNRLCHMSWSNCLSTLVQPHSSNQSIPNGSGNKPK